MSLTVQCWDSSGSYHMDAKRLIGTFRIRGITQCLSPNFDLLRGFEFLFFFVNITDVVDLDYVDYGSCQTQLVLL